MAKRQESITRFSGEGLRWFYAPNETVEGDQIGPRKAFQRLRASGVFSDYLAYSYLLERHKARNHREAVEQFVSAAEAFQPDVIFIQHLNRTYPVDRSFLLRLKSIGSAPRLIFHEADAYGRFVKRMDGVMKMAFAESDMVVIVGLGHMADSVRRAGARRILLTHHSYDDERFGQSWQPTRRRKYDVISIANLTCLKRVPFLFMPGGRHRKIAARSFFRAYGERFAVFGAGQGWAGEPYALGPIAFDSQEAFIRSSWLTFNWSIFDDIPFYFSDRLPISLAAGVPHISNYQPGLDRVFRGAGGVYFVDDHKEALDVADYLLSLPRDKLVEIGLEGAAYARRHFNATRVYGDMVAAIIEQLFGQARPRAVASLAAADLQRGSI